MTPPPAATDILPLPALSAELLRRTTGTGAIWSDSRRYPRKPANFESVVLAASSYANHGHASKSQQVMLRDISRAGVRFLHGDQFFPGERCTLTLPNATILRLEVCWCRRVSPGVFMTGCTFVPDEG